MTQLGLAKAIGVIDKAEETDGEHTINVEKVEDEQFITEKNDITKLTLSHSLHISHPTECSLSNSIPRVMRKQDCNSEEKDICVFTAISMDL